MLPLALAAVLACGCSAESRRARHLERAENYYKSGEYEKAKIEFMNVLRSDPRNATAFHRMGAIWLDQGAPVRAYPFLVRGRDLAPDDVANRLKLARASLIGGSSEGAQKEAAAVLASDPRNGEALMMLAESARTMDAVHTLEDELLKFPDRDSPYYHLAAASLAIRRQDFAGAESALRKA
ncbi:MAG TPA: hypothetical protein VF551_08450, partial [Chthoniobacterales bacterium]